MSNQPSQTKALHVKQSRWLDRLPPIFDECRSRLREVARMHTVSSGAKVVLARHSAVGTDLWCLCCTPEKPQAVLLLKFKRTLRRLTLTKLSDFPPSNPLLTAQNSRALGEVLKCSGQLKGRDLFFATFHLWAR